MKMERKSSFKKACNLLSQMVKEENRSFFSEQFVSINGNNDVRPQKPTTLSLFPGGVEDVTTETETETDSDYGGGQEKSRLTIFYNGKMFVFDDFSEEKAKDLIQLATTYESFPQTNEISQINCPDLLAQTRRASLHGFLYKRKERINAKAPYQVNGTKKMGDVVKPKETPSWLGLGQ